MRSNWVCSLLVLAAIGCATAPTAGDAPRASLESTQWVRTRDGWETRSWDRPGTVFQPALHPLVPAALAVLLSVASLVAFPCRAPQSRGETQQAVRETHPR